MGLLGSGKNVHKTSIEYMEQCFRTYSGHRPKGKVLDIGAGGRKQAYRKIWEAGGWTYEGLNLVAGEGVDIVIDDPWKFDLPDASYDAVISGNMLEHNEFFWLTFLEMSRVLKMGGLMVHIAPSRGVEHRDPQDCWRWYRDGMAAMAKWAGFDLLEATTDWSPEQFAFCDQRAKYRRNANAMRKTMRTPDTVWGDTVGVFVKSVEVGDTLGMGYVRHFAELNAKAAE